MFNTTFNIGSGTPSADVAGCGRQERVVRDDPVGREIVRPFHLDVVHLLVTNKFN